MNENIHDGAQTSSLGKETPRASKRRLKHRLPTVGLRSDGPDAKKRKVERRKMNNNTNALNENHEGPVSTKRKKNQIQEPKLRKDQHIPADMMALDTRSYITRIADVAKRKDATINRMKCV